MRVLIAGCGWLGCAVGQELRRRGDEILGIRRQPSSRAELERAGIAPLILDLSSAGAGARLPADVDAVVACTSAAGREPQAYERAYIAAVRTLLERYAGRPLGGLVYTGSTGVFGQDDGGEVDEATPPAPAGATARILARAEQQVLAAAREGLPARVVRLSGLYGPRRYGIIDRVRGGRLALGPGDGTWMNFCHRDDAVRAVIAALGRGQAGGIYHASDAHPTRRRDVVRWISGRLGIEPPRSSGSRAVRGADRRVSAAWSRDRLGIELAYPSFREGLAEAPALSARS